MPCFWSTENGVMVIEDDGQVHSLEEHAFDQLCAPLNRNSSACRDLVPSASSRRINMFTIFAGAVIILAILELIFF